MKYLDPSDWLVIGLYLAGIIGLGLWSGRGQKNTRDYFLGSRNISWWGVGLAIIASETSTLTFIGIPALAYGEDLALMQIILGYVIARVLLAIVMVPHYFQREIFSPYQLLTRAFGPAAGRCSAALFLLSGTLAAGVRIYVACIPIQLMLGVSMLSAILVFVGFSLVYTYAGGIKAVIWTEVVQFLLFMAGGVFCLVYVPLLVDGGVAGIMDRALAAGKLHWLNTQFAWSLPFNLWMGLLGGTVQVLSSHGANQLIVQRVLTCSTVAAGRKALLLSGVIIFPLFLIFLLTGTFLWAYYQQYPLPIPLPANPAGLKQNDYIFPIFILTGVPNVLKGFLIVAILSAAMSSTGAALSALASVSTMDFVKGLSSSNRNEDYYFRVSKYSTVFWAVLLVLVAYASREVVLVLNWAFALNGLTSGAMLGGVILAVYRGGWHWLAAIVGMSVSVAVMIVMQVYKVGNVGWPWLTLVGTLLTLGFAGLAQVFMGKSVAEKKAVSG